MLSGAITGAITALFALFGVKLTLWQIGAIWVVIKGIIVLAGVGFGATLLRKLKAQQAPADSIHQAQHDAEPKPKDSLPS